MKLTEFVECYAAQRDLEETSVGQYRLAARAFENWAGVSSLDEVTPEQINAHLRWLKTVGRADTTRHSRRRDLLLLLRAARRDFPFDLVSPVKVSDRITRAWTRAQVEHLLKIAGEIAGEYSTAIPRAMWWQTYILAAWDSGMRACDLLSVEYSWMSASGGFSIIQRKTGQKHRVQFSPVTRGMIDVSMRAAPKRALIWPLWGRREVFAKGAKRLIRAAGLQGTMKWLRRASATEIEREHPGCASRHLGHKTPGLAERFYIDYDQLDMNRPTPRPLG